MDSPKTVVSNTSTVVSDSPPVQESPFLNYANNLSPIKPVKVAHGAQGFSALSSTPLVFTSPRTLPDRGTSFSQRSQLYHISSATMSENDDPIKKLVDSSDNVEESFTSGRLMTDTQKNNDQDKPGSFLVRVDEFINDTVDVDCANSVNIENPEQEEGFSQGQSEMEIKLGQAREETHDSKEAPIECQKITSDLPVDQFDDKKHCGGLWPNIIHTHEDYGENTAASTHGPIVKQDPEANQPQRGLSRRCLQFEEARQKRTLNSIHSANLTNNASGSISLASTTELKNQDSSDVELTACSDKQMISIPESTTSTFPPCFIGKSHAVVSKPSGIGLHLNSIINTVPMGYSTMVSIKETAITSCHQDAEDGMLQNHVSLTSGAATSHSTLYALNILQLLEHHLNSLSGRNCNLDYTGNFEELNELSPTKKRRKKSLSNDGDGCKRCNCKKTKCLKLYCDCFAAGIYCAEPCACQGCLNRPEYEDTVLDTRQQIESRNPLAFAPKIVQNVSAFSAATKEDGSRSMQSLSRHKRGCNCKKSMCLKKYCECYQANVGCSSECRCEWCKNVYGRKEDYGMTEGMVINRVSKGRLEGRLDDKLAMVATNDDFLHTELNDMQNITPSTPSIQHSDHGKWAPNSRVRSTTHVLSSYGNSAIDSHSNEMISESKEIEKGKSVGDLDSSGHVFETMGQFSPRCNTLADVYALTPLHSVTIASSASSKTRDWTSGSRFQLRTGSCNLPSSCSLRRQPSPITPMTLLGESKNKGHDPSGLYNILEDETPEILKEASTHTASVKSSSPNKKRVSPPHNHFRDFRSSSSGGLKSGRKFILKSVPSFPSLTPCGKSEGITEEKQQQ